MADNQTAGAVKAALARVEIPGGGNLADYPGLSDIIVTSSAVALAISVEPAMQAAFGPVREAAQKAAEAAAGGRKVMVSLTADRAPQLASAQGGHGRVPPPGKEDVPGIKHIIAVGSGKGGVGKSTAAINLALALMAEGLKVGLLDADLYGPSVPKLLGIEGKPALRNDKAFVPHENFGLKAMSIGSMLTGDQAVAWRGPMASSALKQLLRETDWGGLDVLVIDLPPGTGDIQITIGQQVPLAGAVIVSTPQDLALIDASKAVNLLKRMQVPLLGLIENMSYFIAPDTGKRYDIFGHGGAQRAAAEMGMPFLGEVPLVMTLREDSDMGKPPVAVRPESPVAQAFRDIARKLLAGTPALRT